MSYHRIPLQAGVPYRYDTPGQLLLIDSTGNAPGIDVALVRNGSAAVTMPERKTAFRHVGAFDAVILTAPVDAMVGVFLSFDDVQLGFSDSAAVTVPGGVQITNVEPVPVSFAGTVAPVLGSLTNTNAQAVPTQKQALSNIVDHTPATIGTGAAQLLISEPTYKRLRVKNASASARVALGGSAVTLANAAIILEPGDVWAEDDAAGAGWYAVSDTAGADVRVMGLK